MGWPLLSAVRRQRSEPSPAVLFWGLLGCLGNVALGLDFDLGVVKEGVGVAFASTDDETIGASPGLGAWVAAHQYSPSSS